MATDLGDVVTLSVEIHDPAGDLADAGAVALTVTDPDGTGHSVPVIHAGTGLYSASYTPTLPGAHNVRWVATGVNASSFHDGFYVRADDVPLVSLSDIKAHLNITGAADDEELRAKLAAAHDAVAAHLRRPVSRTTRTDVLTPRGNRQVLVLPRPDIAEIVTVTDNGTTVPAGDYRANLHAGTLHKTTGWTGPVTVTWTTRPVESADVREAVLEMCRHLWDTQRGSARSLPRAGGDMTPGGPPGYALPNRVVELLAPHRSHT